MPLDELDSALERLDPASRALLDLSLRRRVSDDQIGSLLRISPGEVNDRRERVVHGLAGELGLETQDDVVELRAALREQHAEPEPELEPEPEPEPEAAPPPQVITPAEAKRDRRGGRVLIALLALSAAVVLIVVLLAGGGDDAEEGSSDAGAQSAPAGSPDEPAPPAAEGIELTSLKEGVSGTALVVGRNGGTDVELRPTGLEPGSYQVWLYDSVADATSLRRFRGSPEVVLVKLDPEAGRHEFLDVSAEPDDGNPNHSGASVLRIPLGELLGSG